MYTSHHPCWDAKNRYGLPDEIPFEYESISHVIEQVKREPEPVHKEPVQPPARPVHKEPEEKKEELPASLPEPAKQDAVPDYIVLQYSREENVPKALLDLMAANRVTEWDVQNAVGEKGYFPSDMPIEKYPEDFVQGCLIAAWPKVYDLILKTQKTLDKKIPFK